jgi:hypothetical protein
VRHDRGTVDAFHLRDLPGDQHGFERVWGRRRIALAEEARDGKGFGKAENVDRLEPVKDQDADPLGRRKLWLFAIRFLPFRSGCEADRMRLAAVGAFSA